MILNKPLFDTKFNDLLNTVKSPVFEKSIVIDNIYSVSSKRFDANGSYYKIIRDIVIINLPEFRYNKLDYEVILFHNGLLMKFDEYLYNFKKDALEITIYRDSIKNNDTISVSIYKKFNESRFKFKPALYPDGYQIDLYELSSDSNFLRNYAVNINKLSDLIVLNEDGVLSEDKYEVIYNDYSSSKLFDILATIMQSYGITLAMSDFNYDIFHNLLHYFNYICPITKILVDDDQSAIANKLSIYNTIMNTVRGVFKELGKITVYILEGNKDSYHYIYNRAVFYKLSGKLSEQNRYKVESFTDGATILPIPINNLYELDVYLDGEFKIPLIDYSIDKNIINFYKDNLSGKFIQLIHHSPVDTSFNIYDPDKRYYHKFAFNNELSMIQYYPNLYTYSDYQFNTFGCFMIHSILPIDKQNIEVYCDGKKVLTSNIIDITDRAVYVKGLTSSKDIFIRAITPYVENFCKSVSIYTDGIIAGIYDDNIDIKKFTNITDIFLAEKCKDLISEVNGNLPLYKYLESIADELLLTDANNLIMKKYIDEHRHIVDEIDDYIITNNLTLVPKTYDAGRTIPDFNFRKVMAKLLNKLKYINVINKSDLLNINVISGADERIKTITGLRNVDFSLLNGCEFDFSFNEIVSIQNTDLINLPVSYKSVDKNIELINNDFHIDLLNNPINKYTAYQIRKFYQQKGKHIDITDPLDVFEDKTLEKYLNNVIYDLYYNDYSFQHPDFLMYTEPGLFINFHKFLKHSDWIDENVNIYKDNADNIDNITYINYESETDKLTSVRGIEECRKLSYCRIVKQDLNSVYLPWQLLDLKVLIFSNNNHNNIEVSDFSFISKCYNIEYLDISNSQFSDKTKINNMYKLMILKINDTPFGSDNPAIDDISYLSILPNLIILDISRTNVRNITNIHNLPKLQELYADGNEYIDDILYTALEIPNLKILSLKNNQLQDLAEIGKFTNLEELYVDNNPCGGVFNIYNKHLRVISLNGCPIDQIVSTEKSFGLEEIYANDTDISNIDDLDISYYKNTIKIIHLENCSIVNIKESYLTNRFTKDTMIYLYGNNLSRATQIMLRNLNITEGWHIFFTADKLYSANNAINPVFVNYTTDKPEITTTDTDNSPHSNITSIDVYEAGSENSSVKFSDIYISEIKEPIEQNINKSTVLESDEMITLLPE